jgi:RimJ/RimL family protein N-acetyltransferase
MAAVEPLMIDWPLLLPSERLLLRAPQAGDGVALNQAMVQSLDELKPWLPWAQQVPSLEQSELTCRQMAARFAQRSDLPLFIFARAADGGCARLLGGTGLHRADWSVPRFEIGYWRRSGEQGKGWITEAVRTLARFAFDHLGARRVEIRMASDNLKSRAVAERCGFTLEGVLRQDSLDVHGRPRDTAVYARVRGVEEPVRSVTQPRAASRQPQPAIKAATASAAKRGRPRR